MPVGCGVGVDEIGVGDELTLGAQLVATSKKTKTAMSFDEIFTAFGFPFR